MSETIMSTIFGGIAARHAGAAALANAVGAAIVRWWAAYMTWRIEQWAIDRRRRCAPGAQR
jgi:hypothetical protein